MVTSVTRPYKPRTGHLLPLHERWEILRNRLGRLEPGHSALLLSCDEHSCDALQDTIDGIIAAKQAPPVQDWATAQKQDEIRQLKTRYHEAWVALQEAKKEVMKIAHKKWVGLMKILPSDWNTRHFPQVSLSVDDAKFFVSFAEAKAAIDEFMPQVIQIEEYLHSLDEVQAFDADPDKAIYMCIKLLERIEGLEGEVRGLKSKPRKAT